MRWCCPRGLGNDPFLDLEALQEGAGLAGGLLMTAALTEVAQWVLDGESWPEKRGLRTALEWERKRARKETFPTLLQVDSRRLNQEQAAHDDLSLRTEKKIPEQNNTPQKRSEK